MQRRAATTGPFCSIVQEEDVSFALLYRVVQGDCPVPVPHVTLAGYGAVGFGPIRTSPRLSAVLAATTVVEPTDMVSSTLKFPAALTVAVMVPVETVIVDVPLARFDAGKFPLPPSVSVTVAFPPAGKLAMIPHTSTHLMFPDGQVPS